MRRETESSLKFQKPRNLFKDILLVNLWSFVVIGPIFMALGVAALAGVEMPDGSNMWLWGDVVDSRRELLVWIVLSLVVTAIGIVGLYQYRIHQCKKYFDE